MPVNWIIFEVIANLESLWFNLKSLCSRLSLRFKAQQKEHLARVAVAGFFPLEMKERSSGRPAVVGGLLLGGVLYLVGIPCIHSVGLWDCCLLHWPRLLDKRMPEVSGASPEFQTQFPLAHWWAASQLPFKSVTFPGSVTLAPCWFWGMKSIEWLSYRSMDPWLRLRTHNSIYPRLSWFECMHHA